MANDMTAREVERLAVVETKLVDVAEDVKLIKRSAMFLIFAVILYFLNGLLGLFNVTNIMQPQATAQNPATSTSKTAPSTSGSTTSSATAHSDAAQPADSQTSNGGVTVTAPLVPKVP